MAILEKLKDKGGVEFLVRKNVPRSLREQPVWLAYYYELQESGAVKKRPCKGYKIGQESCCKPFDEVIKDGFPGLMILPTNNLIAFDIDDHAAKVGEHEFSVEATYKSYSPEFFNFLTEYDPYVEVSPSGCGLRYLFTCDDKQEHKGSGRVNLLQDHCVGGELFVSSGFVTITGLLEHNDPLELIKNYDEPRALPKISAKEIVPFYNSKYNVIDIETKDVVDEGTVSFERHPTIEEVKQALSLCKLDQSTRSQKIYKEIMSQDYNHYDYWMKIMMACYDYGYKTDQLITLLGMVTEWSKTDLTAFESEDDVLTHWSSFSPEDGKRAEEARGISYRTLFNFANKLKFQWPKPQMDKKGNETGRPLVNEIENFAYLIDYYELVFYQNGAANNFFIDGSEEIVQQYFTNVVTKASDSFGKAGPFTIDDIADCLWGLMQDNHYINLPAPPVKLTKRYLKSAVEQENIMAMWLKTPYEELHPALKEEGTELEKSNIEYLMSLINFNDKQDMSLARKYLDAFFSGIVMPIYNPNRIYPEHTFMLLITGPEACRKTTFLSSLMPEVIAEHAVLNSGEELKSAKSLRDFEYVMTTHNLVTVDEVEILYNQNNEAQFKRLVTTAVINQTQIYQTEPRKAHRIAMLAGTTNKRELPFKTEGSRRVAILDVLGFDTDGMKKINWHHFYNDYIKMGEAALKVNQYNWKLTEQDIMEQYAANEAYRATNSIEEILLDIWDWDHKFTNLDHVSSVQTDNTLWNLTQIKALIRQEDPFANVKSTKLLVNTVKEMCARYTRTTNKKLGLRNCDGFIDNGVLMQGQWKKYPMPPLRTKFIPEESELK